jgi:hypothetical protein
VEETDEFGEDDAFFADFLGLATSYLFLSPTTSLEKTMIERRKPTTEPHPLHDIVMRAFEQQECQDVASLSYFLAGGYFGGKRSAIGNQAYRIVAEDVLGYMEAQKRIYKDEQGWYHKT